MIWECRCVAYKAGERPDLEADIVPDLTELTIEADTYQGAGQGSVPKGVPSSLICPLTQVALSTLLGVLPPSTFVQQFLEIMPSGLQFSSCSAEQAHVSAGSCS